MSTTQSPSVPASRAAPALRPFLIAGLFGGLVATGLNVALVVLAEVLSGSQLLVTLPGSSGPAPLPIVSVLMMSIVPGIAAGVAYWGLHRVTGTPTRWFLILAALAYLAFLPGPFSVSSGATTAVLQAMHVTTVVPILWFSLRVRR